MKSVALAMPFAATAALLAAMPGSAAMAQSAGPATAGWHDLARDTPASPPATATLPVGDDRRFREMTICAEGGTVHLRRVEVRLDGRVWQQLDVPPVLQSGQCSDALDLRGGNRRVHAVRFVYDEASSGGPAGTVVARGRRG